MTFKIGDKVRITKPSDVEKYDWIYWRSEMDLLVGVEFLAVDISPRGSIKGPDSWYFHPDWLELVEETKPQGLKFDDQKPQVGLVFESFPRALIEVAKVAGFGAKKYARGNWLLVDDNLNRYKDALGRHLLQSYIEVDDGESDSMHLAHALWNLLAVVELTLTQKQ